MFVYPRSSSYNRIHTHTTCTQWNPTIYPFPLSISLSHFQSSHPLYLCSHSVFPLSSIYNTFCYTILHVHVYVHNLANAGERCACVCVCLLQNESATLKQNYSPSHSFNFSRHAPPLYSYSVYQLNPNSQNTPTQPPPTPSPSPKTSPFAAVTTIRKPLAHNILRTSSRAGIKWCVCILYYIPKYTYTKPFSGAWEYGDERIGWAKWMVWAICGGNIWRTQGCFKWVTFVGCLL